MNRGARNAQAQAGDSGGARGNPSVPQGLPPPGLPPRPFDNNHPMQPPLGVTAGGTVTASINKPLIIKRNLIHDDYVITQNVLGLGINGKVLECRSKTTDKKYAIKVSKVLV